MRSGSEAAADESAISRSSVGLSDVDVSLVGRAGSRVACKMKIPVSVGELAPDNQGMLLSFLGY